MPEICSFNGISIRMHYGDRRPPHKHDFYAGHEAIVALTGRLLAGHLPARVGSQVRRWCRARQTELDRAWGRASQCQPIERIEPLETR
ncbi:MAG: DUF4160 domain-containing protein [Actinobacteria bacterium]|nr:DUF4160 domain-containing protein [Actinomycetota bacterium]